MTWPSGPVPPRPEARSEIVEQLGRRRVDPYAWLKDENWRAVMRDPSALRPDVRAHLEAENAYTRAIMAGLEGLEARLAAEMRGRIREDDAGVPHPDGPFEYWSRYRPGGEHPLFCRRPRGAAAGTEETLLDGDRLAEGKAFFDLADAEHSPDHALFAYAVDEQGSDYHRIHIFEIGSGRPVGAPIENAEGGFVFSEDSRQIFWVHRNTHARSSKVFRRPVDGGPEDERLVYEEPDEGMFVSVSKTQSGAFIVISTGDHETSAALVVPSDAPETPPRAIEPRTPGLIYSVEHWNGRFLIRTNADGAVDFKLVEAPAAAPGRENWRDLVSHRPGRFILGVLPLARRLLRLERVEANHRLVVRELSGEEWEPDVAEEAYALALDAGWEFDTDVARYVYQSPTTPRTWWDLDLTTRTGALRKRQEVPSGHDPARYRARRIFARAPDGAEVPVTVLTRADAVQDGRSPLLLYGYGSYGLPVDPTFSIRALSLVDRGFGYAIAHVRGGSEKGWGWFLDGRGARKTNTFTDFIAVAERLISEGYVSAGRIVAHGGSAGGMLMGAALNLRPDLFAGVIAAVPFVDVLNTMSDPDLPLTPAEWPEWGNPLVDPEAYDAIAAYSPYDNVSRRAYPAVLATGGLSDPRVTYWEPAKWIARLRAEDLSGTPKLLRINMDAGHGGPPGRFESLKETAFEYAFALRAVGAEDAAL